MGELEGVCLAASDLGQELLHALRTDVVLCGCEETGCGGLRGADGCCNQQTASQCNVLRDGTVSTPKGLQL